MKVLRKLILRHRFKTAMNAGMNASFVRRKDGVVLAFTALVISVLIFVMALAVDSSIALSERSNLQGAADNAARTAALVLGSGGTTSQVIATGKAVAAANGYVDGTNATVTVNVPPLSGNFINYTAAAEVMITETKTTFLASVFNVNQLAYRARAVGDWDFAPCIVALNKSSTPAGGNNTGVTINGSADFTAGCGVYSNSQNTTKSISSSGVLKAGGFAIADKGGTSDASPNLQGPITTSAPYYNYALPSSLSTSPPNSLKTCNNTCKTNKSYLYTSGGKTFIDSSYNYDKAFGEFPNPGSGETFYLEPGKPYFINVFKLGGGGTIDGTGGNILIIQGSGADFQVTGGSYLDLNAMTTAQSTVYADIAIIGTSDLRTATISGGSGGAGHSGLNGLIAIPSTDLTISGGSSTSTSCQTYFAQSVTISGGPGGIGNGCPTKNLNLSAYRGNNLVE